MCMIEVPEEEESKGLRINRRNGDWKFSYLEGWNRHTRTESTESPKQDEPKETLTKTYQNENTKR